MARLAAALLLTVRGQVCELHEVEDLRARYGEVFVTGNRNAASHLWSSYLWSSYILQHAAGCSESTVATLFRGFCPVSGSPLPDDPHTQYQVSLRKIGGGQSEGISHHCCWPCICDMQDNVWVDTMHFATKDGIKQRNALVVGDPCGSSNASSALAASFVDPFSAMSTSLGLEAPEVQCDDGKLRGATFSDHGYPIIGMFFDLESIVAGTEPQQAEWYADKCEERQEQGYNSGMGLIFHKVAVINPISLVQLPGSELNLSAPVSRSALPTLRIAGGVAAALLLAAVAVAAARVHKVHAADEDEEAAFFDRFGAVE